MLPIKIRLPESPGELFNPAFVSRRVFYMTKLMRDLGRPATEIGFDRADLAGEIVFDAFEGAR